VRSSWLYTDRPSVLHRLHPVTKLLSLLLLFVAAFAFNHPLWVLPFPVAAVVLLALGKSLENLKRSAWFIVLFMVLSVLLWSLFLRDVEPVWKWGPFAASPQSLLYGVAVGLRLAFLLLAGMVFLSTTTVESTAYACQRLGMPDMVVLAFTLAFRLVPAFARSAGAAVAAQQARGLQLRHGNPLTRLRRYVPLMAPILARGLRGADDLTRALETRGVGCGARRTYLRRYQVGIGDVLVVVLLAVVTAAVIYARVAGHGGELLPRI
jgi:energy-coupling factor transport system permease protein